MRNIILNITQYKRDIRIPITCISPNIKNLPPVVSSLTSPPFPSPDICSSGHKHLPFGQNIYIKRKKKKTLPTK